LKFQVEETANANCLAIDAARPEKSEKQDLSG